MKKFRYILISFLAVLLLVSVAACGGRKEETPPEPQTCDVTYYIYGEKYASQNVEKGASVEGAAPNSGSGYTFNGWYTDAALTEKANFPFTVNENVSFYGEWQESSFKLSFDTKDGTAIPEEVHHKSDYLTAPVDPVREGYRFTGWYTDADCTKAYEFVGKQMPAHDLTLYAGWEELFAIDFDPKLPEGKNETFRRYVANREGLTVEDPVCPGYVFLGWYVSNEDQTEEMRVPFENPNLVFTGSMQIYGKWRATQKNIKLYFYSEGVAVNSKVLLVDEGAKFPEPEKPSHADEKYYIFDGWFLDEYCTEPVIFDGENATRVSGDYVVKDGRINLYAGWHRDPRYALITFTVAGNSLGSVFAEKGIPFSEALAESLGKLSIPENTVLDGYYSPIGFTYTDKSLVVMDMELVANLYSKGMSFETIPAAGEENPTAKITGYTGSASQLYIPRFFEGKEVVEIAENVFKDQGFTDIYGLEYISTIGASAFQGCASITKIDLSSVRAIGDSAFENCNKLAGVTFGEDIIQFGKNVFNGCSYAGETDEGGNVLYGSVLAKLVQGKDSVTLSATVKTVASEAAKDNTSIQVFTAPGVSYVCKSAFEGCTSLTTAVIAGSAAYVGDRAFYGCSNLGAPAVASPAALSPIAIKTTNAYRAAEIGEYAFYGTAFGTLNFGTTVRYIGAHAFENNEKLTAVTIPVTIVSVGDSAFENCTALGQILIGNSSVTDQTEVYLTSIGANAFAGATALKYVVVRTHLVEDQIFTAGEGWLPTEGDYKFYVSNRPVPIDTKSQYYGNGMMTYKEIFQKEMPAYSDKILSMSEIKPVVEILVEQYELTAAAADSGLNVLSLIANRLMKDGKTLEITKPSNDFIAEATYENSHWTYIVDTVTKETPEGDVVEPATSNGALYRLSVGTYYVNFTLINGFNCTTTASLKIVVTEN